MSPIDPRLVRARRFPVHAAVDRCNELEVRRYEAKFTIYSLYVYVQSGPLNRSFRENNNLLSSYYFNNLFTYMNLEFN